MIADATISDSNIINGVSFLMYYLNCLWILKWMDYCGTGINRMHLFCTKGKCKTKRIAAVIDCG